MCFLQKALDLYLTDCLLFMPKKMWLSQKINILKFTIITRYYHPTPDGIAHHSSYLNQYLINLGHQVQIIYDDGIIALTSDEIGVLINKIKRHLELANKGYFEHMFFAMKIGLKCLWSFVTAFIHAINPAWFEYTTSKRIKRMNDLFQKPKTDIKE